MSQAETVARVNPAAFSGACATEFEGAELVDASALVAATSSMGAGSTELEGAEFLAACALDAATSATGRAATMESSGSQRAVSGGI